MSCLLPVVAGFVVPAGIFLRMALTTNHARAAEIAIDHGKNSLTLAVMAAVAAVTLGMLLAYARRLDPRPLTGVASRAASAGYALPGTVLGLGLLVPLTFLDHRINELAGRLFGSTSELILTGSVFAVLLGYQSRFVGVALALMQPALERVRPSLDDAARTLGASRPRILLRLHLPMLRASVLAAGLLVFVDVVKELPATLMLRPFNFETLAVRTYQPAADERLEQAAYSALLIIALGLIPVVVLSRLMARDTRPALGPSDAGATENAALLKP
ncbi:MAG: ABC transporter permease subunit [Planctomycetota bacterium]